LGGHDGRFVPSRAYSAVPLAALLPGGPLHERLRGQRVALVLSGGNVDLDALPAMPKVPRYPEG